MTNNTLIGSGLWQRDILEKVLYKAKNDLEFDKLEEAYIDVEGNFCNFPLRDLLNRIRLRERKKNVIRRRK
jgi:hypothetical protein